MNNWNTKDNLTDLVSNLPAFDNTGSNDNLSDNKAFGFDSLGIMIRS